jgi:hypothetical protein
MDFRRLAALVMLNVESEWSDAAVPCRPAALASTPRSTDHKATVALAKSFICAQMCASAELMLFVAKVDMGSMSPLADGVLWWLHEKAARTERQGPEFRGPGR